MTIKLNGSTAGSVALDAPASTTSGANIEFKLPVADGSTGQFIKTDGSGNLAFATATDTNDFVKLTNVVSTTSVDSILHTNLDTTTYKAFRLVFAALPATDNVHLTFRFMNGSNVEGDSNYSWGIMGVSGGSSHYEDHGVGNANARIHNNSGNADYEGWRHVMDIVCQTTNDWTGATSFASWVGNRVDGSNNYRWESGSLYYENDADTDGFILAPSNGQFNKYSYTLYGVKR